MDSNLPILHCSCNGWVCIALNIQSLDSLYWEQEVFWATAEVNFRSIGQVYGYFISDRVFHSLFRFLEISGELLLTSSLETGECRAYLGIGRCVILNFVIETFQLLQTLALRRADGEDHTRPLLVTPWTWPRRAPSAKSPCESFMK